MSCRKLTEQDERDSALIIAIVAGLVVEDGLPHGKHMNERLHLGLTSG